MIKVIEKTFDILTLISTRKKAALAEIAAALGENKTTLSNILRTLVDLGQLARDGMNNYILGPKLKELALADYKRDTLGGIAERVARDLTDSIHEAVVIAVMDAGERVTIAETRPQQGIMVNTGIFRADSAYDKATGRVLLALLPSPERDAYIQANGLPDKQEWAGAGTKKQLETELTRIKKEGMESMVTASGDVQALAVPVTGPDGTCWASVGAYLPLMRFKGKHRTQVTEQLKAAGETMARRLALLH